MITNMPKDDVWELIDNDGKSQNFRKKFKFDFSYMESDSIKNTIKTYIWKNYKEGNKTLKKLYDDNGGLKLFNDFLIINNKNSLRELTNNDSDLFISYLKTCVSDKTNKPFTYATQKIYLDKVKAIIHWGQLHMPNDVPKIEIFTGNEYIGINRKLKIDFIPDEVLIQINKALKNEENPYVKYGIIILQSTGMRIGDMLKLTTDCIKPHLISGYTLTWYDHKSRKQRQPMPITNECAIAVEKLIECKKEFREQSDDEVKDNLFIYQVAKGKNIRKIMTVTQISMGIWFNIFIKINEIKDTNGVLYNLTAHQFRRTLATDMLSKGTDITVIRDVLGHSSSETTKRSYADIKDKERAEVFKNIGIIGNINKVDETIITDNEELKWFNKNKDSKARMEDGYCTKPCSDGKICDRLLKRQKCYTCGRYVTTPEYLQAHKSHLKELENQIEGNIYGEHYAEHFIPTTEILKEIIRRLEELQDGNREVAITSNN
ncbi:site-specific integrase [Clostridium bowmanii]|uniref:tyrosine-type recombinase/integrase n=1 Tax=Clostridium bowmanii TaxID=132925 RepID=UPI001C0DC85E|nr:site-specific integrase [Clostridium bowmanii]MBU3191850.1 site-specific integrase [Clostridium bowmanii]MCA1076160.1 site-specific integrase [Clostridium bowmanii]